MTYRLPKAVQVGPFIYSIERSPDVDSNGNVGEADHILKKVRFGERCSPRQLPITLLHELIHVVAENAGMEMEHRDVRALSSGLAQALMDLGLLPEEMELGD